MRMGYQEAIMLIGFGGPEKPEEVRPFLESVLKGIRIPKERFEEVLHHYEAMGGVSPYNAITYRQQKALQKQLTANEVSLPVVVGFRHSHPSFEDALRELRCLGVRRVIGFVLSCLRSYSSFDKYVEWLRAAQEATGTQDIEFVFTEPFHNAPDFIAAQSSQLAQVMSSPSSEDTYYLFSAHSIPCAIADQSGYHRQFEEISRLIAEECALQHWGVAYQSRSGSPKDPWLEPSVESVIERLDIEKYKKIVLIPAGFLCDNVEVLFDLDTEAKELCDKRGLEYRRAQTVMDHPLFICLMAELIENKIIGTLASD